MDDNAQKPATLDASAPQQAPAPVQPSQQTPAPVQPAAISGAQRPVEPPSAPRHPEQGPVPRMREVQTTPEEAEAASSVQASSDDSPDTPDTAPAEQEAVVTESHPDVEVAQELKDAGVQPSDAKRDQLLEEKKQLEVAAVDPAQVPAPATDQQTVEELSKMDLVQAEEAAKVEKKPRNALSWIIREVLRFRKQEQPPEKPVATPEPQPEVQAAQPPAPQPPAEQAPAPQPPAPPAPAPVAAAPTQPKEGVVNT